MKVRWLKDFMGQKEGYVGEIPDYDAQYWLSRGVVEKVKVKAKEAPERKVIEAEVKK